jgi:serine/threonine-protein kinase RsbW
LIDEVPAESWLRPFRIQEKLNVTMAATATANGRMHVIRLTIPAKPEYITLGRLALTGIARLSDEPLTPEVLGDLKLALTEACTNSVRHAYAGGSGMVEIVYELHYDRLVVEVCDAGPGFVPPPARAMDDDEAIAEGGLGIAIIRALADEFEVADRAEGGSRLRFAKRLTA